MRPILFLDFDGVLNSADFQQRWRAAHAGTTTERLHDQLDPAAVQRLNDVVRATGAAVVVSSTWRLCEDSNTVEKLQAVLERFGFTGTVVGVTPSLGCSSHAGYTCDEGARGAEIEAYLAALPQRPAFAIVDDSADMQPHLHKLVRTSWQEGLQGRHVMQLSVLLLAQGGLGFNSF